MTLKSGNKLSQEADQDLDEILDYTLKEFGLDQGSSNISVGRIDLMQSVLDT
ncbi:MAG: hypothetical protein RJQ14_20470 [Marinoscillum sp.]